MVSIVLPLGHVYKQRPPTVSDSTLMYLDIGASNAIGAVTTTIDQPFNTERSKIYKHNGSIVGFSDAPNNQSGDTTYPNLNTAGTQNRNSFLVEMMRETTDKKICLVQGGKNAVGITNQITGFNSSTVMAEITSLCAAAKSAVGTGFQFAIVNVTDGDSKFGTSGATMGTIFDSFCTNLRTATGNSALPIIMIGLGEDSDPVTYPSWTTHREYFKDTHTADNFYFVQTDDLDAATYCESDGIHWNATGHKEIAKRILHVLKAIGIVNYEPVVQINLSGQSNAGNLAYSAESAGDNGMVVCKSTLESLLTYKRVDWYAGHEGGSGSDENSNAVEYWWHSGNDERGVELDQYFDGDSERCDFVYHDLVATDANYNYTKIEYKELQLDIFNEIWAVNPATKIVLRRASRRTAFGNPGGYQTVREAQRELAAENTNVFLGVETYDLDLYDTVHNTDAAIAVEGERLGRLLAKIMGKPISGSVEGPQITSASRSGTTVTVVIAHDGGSDFTPTTGIDGFKFYDDSTKIAISSAVRTDASTITLILATTPTGVETLYYGYDAMVGINITNIVKDNSSQALPLQTATVSVT